MPMLDRRTRRGLPEFAAPSRMVRLRGGSLVMRSASAATARWGPLQARPIGSPCPATLLAAMGLRSRLGRLSRRAWPRRIAVLVALLAVVVAVLPASASTRDYSGALRG